jgi:hypothetical protein
VALGGVQEHIAERGILRLDGIEIFVPIIVIIPDTDPFVEISHLSISPL